MSAKYQQQASSRESTPKELSILRQDTDLEGILEDKELLGETTFVPQNTPFTQPRSPVKHFDEEGTPLAKKLKVKGNCLKSRLYSNSSQCRALAVVKQREKNNQNLVSFLFVINLNLKDI